MPIPQTPTLLAFLCISLLAGATLFAKASAAQSATSEECRRSRRSIAEMSRATEAQGPEQRARLIARLDALAERYQKQDPVCGGQLRELQARLYVLNGQFAEGADMVRDYLGGPGHQTTPTYKLALNNRLGYMLSRLGKTLEASQAYFYAATYADEAPPAYGARALGDAAITAHKLGDFDSADAYIRSALSISDDSLSTDPTLRDVLGRNLIAATFLAGDRLRAAPPRERSRLARSLDSVSTRALDVLDSPSHAGLRSFAINHHALAAAYHGQFDLARSRLRTSLPLASKARLETPGAVFDSWINRSRILTLSGDFAGAERAGTRALDAATEAASLGDEATALEQLGRIAELDADLLRAETIYREAIDRREADRARLGLQDWSATSFARAQAPYRGLVRVYLAQGRITDALTVLDQTKARYLSDLRRHLAVRSLAEPSVRSLADSMSTLIEERRRHLLNTQSAGEKARLTREMSRYQAEIERAVGARPEPPPLLDLAALQAELESSGRTLLSYFIGDETSTAFVVRSDTVLSIALPVGRYDIQDLLSEAGSPWRASTDVDPVLSLTALHNLYLGLVEPVRSFVDTDAVVIIPDGETAVVPFAALPTLPSQGYEHTSYVLHDWSIGTELAASFVYAPAVRVQKPSLALLALGQNARNRSTWNDRDRDLDTLPNAVAEVDHLGTFRGSRIRTGEQATEQEYNHHAPRANVVHVASHAVVQTELPMYSSIELAPGDGEDGTIYLYELMTHPLIADLVVLSGCSTASGDLRGGESILSLEYAVRAAGASASIATLWAVDDQATERLMTAFYDRLEAGERKDHALRGAQLSYLASHNGMTASPFYWAAPVLSGPPTPVSLQYKRPWWMVGVIALAAGVPWWLRRTYLNDRPPRTV